MGSHAGIYYHVMGELSIWLLTPGVVWSRDRDDRRTCLHWDHSTGSECKIQDDSIFNYRIILNCTLTFLRIELIERQILKE